MVVIISMDEKKVEGMLGNERLGFDEVFPLLTHTLESDNGFDGKPCENVCDYLKGKKGFLHFTQRKEGNDLFVCFRIEGESKV